MEFVPLHYDVIIVGAGPSGLTAALTFQDTDLKVLLLERGSLPKTGIYGNAIPQEAIDMLDKIGDQMSEAFGKLPVHYRSQRIRLSTDYSDPWELENEIQAYTCTRTQYDQVLCDLIASRTNVEILTEQSVQEASLFDSHIKLVTQDHIFHAKMVIGCDGSHSFMSQLLRQESPLENRHVGEAIRIHYNGVTGMVMDRTEIFVKKDFVPGYFWLFPLPNGEVNSGFGMNSRSLQKQGGDLYQKMQEFIQDDPELKERFENAKVSRAPQTYQLPFGSQQVPISTNRLLLAGDAAQLVDPFSMKGFNYAALSGNLAAKQAMICFERDAFDAEEMKKYDAQLWRGLGSGLRHKSWVQELAATYPTLINLSMRLMQFPAMRQIFQRYL